MRGGGERGVAGPNEGEGRGSRVKGERVEIGSGGREW